MTHNQANAPPTSWTRDKKILYSINDSLLINTKRSVINQLPRPSRITAAIAPATKTATTQPQPSDDRSRHQHNHHHHNHHHHHHHHRHHHHQNSAERGRHRRDEPMSPPTSRDTDNICTIDKDSSGASGRGGGVGGVIVATTTADTSISAPTAPNTTIIGHYELKKTLGKGNFSTVKLAQHRITQHSVAIKVVKTSILSENNLMKINREIDVLKKIGKHDHIVRLYQVIKTKRYFMLVTEYCANGELYDYLVDKGKLSEPQSCDYFLQILSAIEYLHDHNIVHRDLKAENLLLDNDFKTVKIADFGFANYFKQDNLLNTWCGSPPYAAPELFKGLNYVGPPVDIWSIGVILYVLVCGSLPFDGHNLVYLKSRVLSGKFRIPFFMSTECEGLIRGMLRLDPERRFNIRQIKAHSWVAKHGKKETVSESKGQPSSTVFMETTNNNPPNSSIVGSSISNASSARSLDKNGSNNRGQSLDLDEDKKETASNDDEDASMSCLTGGEKSVFKPSQKNSSSSPTTIQKFVDTEIANAVSNMSLDSNNSSMSVSQSINTISNHSAINSGATSRMSSIRTDTTSGSMIRNFSEESSIDNQIIEYMVDGLKVAESQKAIRESIANDKYDDLHAIYRLIKDQPGNILEKFASTKFKIPSLPLISLNKQQGIKKPSITTGFFNPSPVKELPVKSMPFDHNRLKNESHQSVDVSRQEFQKSQPINDSENLAPNQNGAIDLAKYPAHDVFKADKSEKTPESFDDQSWYKPPPQLFLTPPSENRVVTGNDMSVAPPNKSVVVSNTVDDFSSEATEPFNSDTKPILARHSFDSTMHHLRESFGKSNQIANKLNLSNNDKHCLWDSSILDTIGITNSPIHTTEAILAMDTEGTILQGENVRDAYDNSNSGNMLRITTNLPIIDAQPTQNMTSPNNIIAQLNSLTSASTIRQSGMFSRFGPPIEQKFQIEFTPNNLMNQNYNAMNTLAMQSTLANSSAQNSSLLDPNGAASGLERRASDGQASYSSLTVTNSENNGTQTITPNNNQSSVDTTTGAFLSSSSNQLSSTFFKPNQQPLTYSRDAHLLVRNEEKSSSNNSMTVSKEDQRTDQNNNVYLQEQGSGSTQLNPLDLTKGPKTCCERKQQQQQQRFDPNVQSSFNTNLYRFDEQLGNKSTSQRSHSTTSASVVFHNLPTSATTSPRSSFLLTSANKNGIPFGTVSPSSVSLTGGGPGHLLNRRKRHSLDTESRNQHYHQQARAHLVHHITANHQHLCGYNESSRALRQSNQQYLQYPASSHIGQLRNFAQTFSYKKLIKGQPSPTTSWDPAPASAAAAIAASASAAAQPTANLSAPTLESIVAMEVNLNQNEKDTG